MSQHKQRCEVYTKLKNIKMIENQALEHRICEDLERVKGSSAPKPRINKYLTFNYINYLAYISAL